MHIPDISGFWTGDLFGTNRGGFTLDIKQDGEKISGIAKIQEPALGLYEYHIAGSVKDGLSLKLTPGLQSGGLRLGMVQAICTLEADGTLLGRWKSELGTEGTFTAKRFASTKLSSDLPKSNSVFLVHGHDEGSKHAVARFL